MSKKIAIVGLGLIGGSFAKAFKEFTDYTVIGFNRTRATAEQALLDGAIDKVGEPEDLKDVDFILLSLYPKASADFIENNIEYIKKGCIITDDCGVKTYLVKRLVPICKEHDLYYVGGHPMAGKEVSGYKASSSSLYKNASMLLVPTETSPRDILEEVKSLFMKLGFGQIVVTTADHHDRMIAYTSQLCHVISSAYVKNRAETEHKGYSGGSYRDLTRVAYLNETMWTELFLENAEALVPELDEVIYHLQEYRDTIAAGDEETLFRLLKEGRERKQRFG